MSKKFKIVTLGCRTNQYESQGFRDQLTRMGYEPAEHDREADLCIVNTCTVTQSADSSSRHEIRNLSRQHPKAKIVVTGCSSERDPEAFKALEGVVDVVPNAQKEELVSSLFPDRDVPEFSIKNFDAHTRAFVKVQDGCNSFCTYCIIPYVRGRSRSRKLSDVLSEVESLVENGFKEVVITGINVGDFEDPPHTLADLVRAVDNVEGIQRVRISSIDPDEVDDDLADAVLNGKNTCPSMHIVLQSGSNVMLKRMNRKYTRQMFMDTVERLKKASPDFTFTTDVIVGFPGETEADFQDTIDMLHEVRFAKVHMFPFSPRKRTRAALYPDQINPEIKKKRKQEVLRVSEKIAFDLREEFVGREMVVLTERNDGESFGHTDNFLGVRIEGATYLPNELVSVKLAGNSPGGLIGIPVPLAKQACGA